MKMEKFTPLARNFTLPPGLTGWTNSTSATRRCALSCPLHPRGTQAVKRVNWRFARAASIHKSMTSTLSMFCTLYTREPVQQPANHEEQ